MVQVYKLLDSVRDKLRANTNVNTVSFGEITDIDLTKTTIYPLAHFNIDRAVIGDRTITFTIKVLCCDIVDYNKEQATSDVFYGNDNTQDILNTQLQVVNDIVMQLRRGDLYESQMHVSENVVVTPFLDRFKDMVAGWGADIDITMVNDISICSGNFNLGQNESDGYIGNQNGYVNFNDFTFNQQTGEMVFIGSQLPLGAMLQVEFLKYPITTNPPSTWLGAEDSTVYIGSGDDNILEAQWFTPSDVLVRWWIAQSTSPFTDLTPKNEKVLTVTRVAERWLGLTKFDPPSTYYNIYGEDLGSLRFYNVLGEQSVVTSSTITQFITNWNNDPSNADFIIDNWKLGSNNEMIVHVVPANSVISYPFPYTYIRVY